MILAEKYTIRQVVIDYQFLGRQVRCNVLVQVYNNDTLLVQNADEVIMEDSMIQEKARVDNVNFWGEPQILQILKEHYGSNNVAYYEPPELEPESEETE